MNGAQTKQLLAGFWLKALLLLFCGFLPTFGAVEVRFLAWDQGIAERPLFVRTGESVETIESLHHLRRSRPVEVFFPAEDDQDSPRPVLSEDVGRSVEDTPILPLEIPPGIKQPLVLLTPDPAAPLGLRLLVIEDDPSNFPWGSFRIFNTSRKDLLLVTRDQRVDLPGGWEVVDFQLSAEENEAVLIALEDSNEDFKVLYTSIWRPDPRSRRLVLIVPSGDQRLGVIALRVIPEFRSSPTSSSEPGSQ